MRVDYWREALQLVFDDAAGRSFRWGSHDCCQFAARAYQAVTGRDALTLFPRYESRRHAERILADHGGMRGLIEKALGEAVHPSRAGAGDIVLIDMGRGLQPAVCMGHECFAPERRGLDHRKTSSAEAAWIF